MEVPLTITTPKNRRKPVEDDNIKRYVGHTYDFTKGSKPLSKKEQYKIGKSAHISKNLFESPYVKDLLRRSSARKCIRRLESIIRSRELYYSVKTARKKKLTYPQLAKLLNDRQEFTPRGLPWTNWSLNRFILRYEKMDGEIGQRELKFLKTENRLVKLAQLNVPSLYIADILNLEKRWTRLGHPWSEMAVNKFIYKRRCSLNKKNML